MPQSGPPAFGLAPSSPPMRSLSTPAPRAAALLAAAETHLVCALQPIVDLRSGIPHGYEALMRGYGALGAADPLALLDLFAEAGAIVELEVLLHRLAARTFAAAQASFGLGPVRLFLNMDSRAMRQDGEAAIDEAIRQMKAFDLPLNRLAWEFSEREPLELDDRMTWRFSQLRADGVRLAADDFGRNHSDMRLLFEQPLDYMKIDRFFVHDIAQSGRRRLFVSKLVSFAHLLGLTVIAEGIETAEDLRACRELGCDMGQGWFISTPINPGEPFAQTYPAVAISGGGRRPNRRAGDRTLRVLAHRVLAVPPVMDDDRLDVVINRFGQDPDQTLCPVVDAAGAPVGVISERVLRQIVYNPYGRDLMRNASANKIARRFALVCPKADIDSDLDSAFEAFASQPGAPCLLVTEAGRYLGLIPPSEMLADTVETRLADASAQNPLTGLPGNLQIQAAMARAATLSQSGPVYRHICYFDFDNFKPFNDVYGFRVGDRAITMFAEALRRSVPLVDHQFIGHVGGDDFVAVLYGATPAEVQALVAKLLAEFAEEASRLHHEQDRQTGWFAMRDRYGEPRRFPLLRASAATVTLDPGVDVSDLSCLDPIIARLKSVAKSEPSGAARFEAADEDDLLRLGQVFGSGV